MSEVICVGRYVEYFKPTACPLNSSQIGLFDPQLLEYPNPSISGRIESTVEPPVSDHSKCKDLVVDLREMVAYKNRTTWGLYREEVPGTSTLWKVIYCMQFLSYIMCSSMFY